MKILDGGQKVLMALIKVLPIEFLTSLVKVRISHFEVKAANLMSKTLPGSNTSSHVTTTSLLTT